jgi:O-6-methylguanine DNA methyltransferase
LIAEVNDDALLALDFEQDGEVCRDEHPLLDKLKSELRDYFEGKRKSFSLPLAPKGTPFQKTVWQTLTRIPYGATVSYSTEASMLEHPKAVRAVANANGKNKIAIIIPCHRVIAKNGGIGGYSGGLWRKEYLLALEAKYR